MRAVPLLTVFVCVLVTIPVGWFILLPSLQIGMVATGSSQPPQTAASNLPSHTSITFFGDILLARAVERQQQQWGMMYPFSGFSLATSSYGVANFESAVPPVHQPTPDGSVRFSTMETTLPALRAAGFTHVSLANNHSYDFGTEALKHTQSKLKAADVVPFGHPWQNQPDRSITYLEIQGGTVALIGIHSLLRVPSTAELSDLFAAARERSDAQVVFIHWGTEYQMTHSIQQQVLADKLVQAGADLIVGHHPHVVQDISLIGDVPVLYSLGNYIFDQYFSISVQEGLVAELTLTPQPALILQPVSSITTPGQPRPLTGAAKTAFLYELADRSHPALTGDIQNGVLPLPKFLATSTETVIIDDITLSYVQ